MKSDLNQNPRNESYDSAAASFGPVYGGDERDDVAGNLWHDVFVERPMPWVRFLESIGLHSAALILIYIASVSGVRQQKILEDAHFDRPSVITYTPQEYLPPLDTGTTQPAKSQLGDPVYAKQPILSVPREASSRSQTVVVPPNVALDKDVRIPNIVASGTILPAVPLDATLRNPSRIIAPDAQVIAPAPDVQTVRDRIVNAAMNIGLKMKTDVIVPPPEVALKSSRGMIGPGTAVIAPPPELAAPAKGRTALFDIGSSTVVAPAPQLALDRQHVQQHGAGRGTGIPGASVQPVAPPPSISTSGNAHSGGRLVALGIHPIAASGPVAVPRGNRRGIFEANPQGRLGASGTPQFTGMNESTPNQSTPGGIKGTSKSLTSELHVGGPAGSAGKEGRELASASKGAATKGPRSVLEVSDDKITDEDRKVFGGKRPYAMTMNMPNLNSSTGSWEIRFAEVGSGGKAGELLAPVATEKSDPGYPLELIRSNVQGMVTLYAVIGADGKVASVRVLNSPDDRLDAFASKALSRCKFAPAERAGKPVALEALVRIPFRVRRNF